MKKYSFYLFFLSIILIISSCGVNSYVMFKDSDAYVEEEIPLSPLEEYRLVPNDKFNMLLYVENGARLIDLTVGLAQEGNGSSQRLQTGGQIDYLIRSNGEVELPVLGLVNLLDLTIIEAQEKLKMLYKSKYVDPFIQLEVTNRRAIVFPGSGGSAKVIPIKNDNTTLMEVIALAGGLTERGKANKIKLMRNTEEGRKLYQIDLSTVEGIKYADMIVQSNDYIYVEPTKQISREVLKELTPIVSLITTSVAIFTLILSIK